MQLELCLNILMAGSLEGDLIKVVSGGRVHAWLKVLSLTRGQLALCPHFCQDFCPFRLGHEPVTFFALFDIQPGSLFQYLSLSQSVNSFHGTDRAAARLIV